MKLYPITVKRTSTVSPVDAYSANVNLSLVDGPNALPTDESTAVLTALYAESNVLPADTSTFNIAAGFGDANVLPSDTFGRLDILGLDTNALPADVMPKLSIFAGESNVEPADAPIAVVKGFGDSNTLPTDTRLAAVRYGLTGSTGTSNVTNPGNANGGNDGTSSSQQTAPASATTSTLTSSCGVNIPAGTAFSTAIYRGWFNVTQALTTSHTKVIIRSTSALFTDIETVDIRATVNHNSGDFTFNLISAGVDTLVKLQSVQILHTTSDSLAGVTPAVLTVDAGCIELTGVFS